MTTALRQRLPSWMVGTGVIAVSMAVMNVSTYGFTLVTARLLGPREYGALAAVMGLVLVLNVLSLGLQATAARRVSTAGGHVAATEREIVVASYRLAASLTVVTLMASPLVATFLRLDSLVPAVLLAVSMLPLTVMGAQAGLLQGERRWAALASLYAAMGLSRLALGIVATLWRPDVTGAMTGVTVASFVPAVLGWWLLRRPRNARPAPTATDDNPRATAVLREVVHNSHALLAFFALSTADVLIARNVLDDRQAGLYAGGLILTKAVLFLPQFVIVLVFPDMALSPDRHRVQDLALLTLALIGLITTLGAALLPGLAVAFVGGTEYSGIQDRLWAFAAIGALTAMLQLLVYGTVARQHRRAVWLIWGGVVVLAVVGLGLVGTVDGLLITVAAVDTAVLLMLLWLRHAVPAPAREPTG